MVVYEAMCLTYVGMDTKGGRKGAHYQFFAKRIVVLLMTPGLLIFSSTAKSAFTGMSAVSDVQRKKNDIQI